MFHKDMYCGQGLQLQFHSTGYILPAWAANFLFQAAAGPLSREHCSKKGLEQRPGAQAVDSATSSCKTLTDLTSVLQFLSYSM